MSKKKPKTLTKKYLRRAINILQKVPTKKQLEEAVKNKRYIVIEFITK